MALRRLLASAALASALLLDQQATKATACSCAAIVRDICDYVEDAAVVLRATALSRSDQVDINDDVSYTVSTVTLYKGEPNVRYAQEISFLTGGNSAACGVELELDEEYLLGLYRAVDPFDSDRDGQLVVGSCDLVREWSSITDEEQENLEGCSSDTCGGSCTEYQECFFYMDDSTQEEEYFCADVCDPSPCGDDEVCTLKEVHCVREPCPPVATCTDSCNDDCDEFQECRQYEGDGGWYCSDTCDEKPCGSGRWCSSVKHKWCRGTGYRGCPRKIKCH